MTMSNIMELTSAEGAYLKQKGYKRTNNESLGKGFCWVKRKTVEGSVNRLYIRGSDLLLTKSKLTTGHETRYKAWDFEWLKEFL